MFTTIAMSRNFRRTSTMSPLKRKLMGSEIRDLLTEDRSVASENLSDTNPRY